MARNNRARGRVRSRGKVVLNAHSRMVKYFAFIQRPGLGWRDWTFRTLSQRQAEQLVRAHEAETITGEVDGVVQVVGYRALNPTSWERPSPCTLTLSTMIAVGNYEPGNPAARLSKRERLHVEKFIAWPFIGDTKAVAVRPRVSDRDRAAAQSLFQSGYLQKAA